MMMMISACVAASAGEAQALQPAALSGATDSGRRPYTATLWPAFFRLRAIGLLMMPRPLNATFIVFLPWPYVGLSHLYRTFGSHRPICCHRYSIAMAITWIPMKGSMQE